jgi:serine protease Do
MQTKTILRYILVGLAIVLLSGAGGFLGTRLGSANATRVLEGNTVQGNTGSAELSVPSETSQQIARAFQDQFRLVADQTLPVVVELTVLSRVSRRQPANPLDFFFGNPRDDSEQEEYLQQGAGSGVIIGKEGDTVYVLTNDHVVGNAAEIEISLFDGRTFEGEVMGTDELIDIALVTFTSREDIPTAVLGNSDSLRPGDWVFAVGNPLGFESTVTAGIVSATGRLATQNSQFSGLTDYIQTDAAVNRGNSGGALVNLEGEVVGINTWIASQTGGSIGLGFAVPVNNVKRVVADLMETGEVEYSWLGVSVASVDDDFAEQMGFDVESGAFISGVYENSPAEDSGLRPGDIVTRIGEREIRDSSTLVQVVGRLEPGETTPFEIVRNGEAIAIDVRTGRRTEESFVSSSIYPGLSVIPVTAEARDELDLSRRTRGVIVSRVDRGTPAAESGIRPGDIITTVNDEEIESPAEFYQRLGEVSENEIQFRVIREGRTLILGFVRSST